MNPPWPLPDPGKCIMAGTGKNQRNLQADHQIPFSPCDAGNAAEPKQLAGHQSTHDR